MQKEITKAMGMMTDFTLLEFVTLQEEVKLLNDRLELLKSCLRGTGSFSTENFVCAVIEQQQTRLKPLDAVIAALGKEILEENNLITKSSYHIVKVRPKESL